MGVRVAMFWSYRIYQIQLAKTKRIRRYLYVFIYSMLAHYPRSGDSSVRSLGVPFKALIHLIFYTLLRAVCYIFSLFPLHALRARFPRFIGETSSASEDV